MVGFHFFFVIEGEGKWEKDDDNKREKEKSKSKCINHLDDLKMFSSLSLNTYRSSWWYNVIV